MAVQWLEICALCEAHDRDPCHTRSPPPTTSPSGRTVPGYRYHRRVDRERFPGLGDDWVRLDGPAGTQAVDEAIEAAAAWWQSGDPANAHGQFPQAAATDALVWSTRDVCAELVGCQPDSIVFGESMTSLTMRFAAAVG
jgi:selenocysteine lyase/cysteine desulfurase